MMYHLDGRRHCQSLVYFGEPQGLAHRHTRNPYIYIYIYICIYIHIVYMYTGLGGWPLKTDLSD